ncbi:MAG TPA: hypothetical protein PKN64_09880 [Casimicrobium sp.]|nr:hypothetical protein [Casimicrobium sp.]
MIGPKQKRNPQKYTTERLEKMRDGARKNLKYWESQVDEKKGKKKKKKLRGALPADA